MEQTPPQNIYEAENAEKLVSDVFSGSLSLEQALQKLRTRLLDLSARNRLLNYRHPKGRSIQFVDEPNLNLVFSRLIDNKSLLIKYIPEPPTNTYVIKRPDVKAYAQSRGIGTEYDFSSDCCGESASKHAPKLQSLYYPAELDKLSRKLSSESRTIIEETGTNMLYLVFGFLELYDKEDSETPMLAPLLAIPVSISKGGIDPETRTYQYSLTCSGEDIHENQTLREKLSQDFGLQLPEFDEDDEPGTYFEKIQTAFRNKKRWKVRYQLTLGFLSFGKLAIWDDLDPTKWPGLLKNSLLQLIFSGGSRKGASLFPEDYDIDKHPQGELPVIFDADSSQHSAIIDVMAGKNIVINGPPGTGKSQTITNIIAVGLKAGKKILFVSEKLAALEVVKHRLSQADLGHFCLELHSHKSQKKKILSDLQERVDGQFKAPQMFQEKSATLRRHKGELNRYSELMSTVVRNELGLSTHEAFWRTERRRQAIGDLSSVVQSLFLNEASYWAYDDIEQRRAKLEALGQLYCSIGLFDVTHPWWGFTPKSLAPGDDEAIGQIIKAAASSADLLSTEILEFQTRSGLSIEPTTDELAVLGSALAGLTPPPANLECTLLSRVFTEQDPWGTQNRELIASVISKTERARKLNTQADALLNSESTLSYAIARPVVSRCSPLLAPEFFGVPLNEIQELVNGAVTSHAAFKVEAEATPLNFVQISAAHLQTINSMLLDTSPLVLSSQSLGQISAGVTSLLALCGPMSAAYSRIAAIAKQRNIEFNGSPSSVSALGSSDGVTDLLPAVAIDDELLEKAKQAASSIMADFAIGEIAERQAQLTIRQKQIGELLDELGGYAKQCNLELVATPNGIAQLISLAKVASTAPSDLLDFRQLSLSHPRIPELVDLAEADCNHEKTERTQLDADFYLDALPNVDDLKAAIRVFRRGDSLFNIFNGEWRAARRLFNEISRTKPRHKATEYERILSRISGWLGHRAAIIANNEFKEALGLFFRGLDTDFVKIRRLHQWYSDSQAELLQHPGFAEQVDLSALHPQKISQLTALRVRFEQIRTELEMHHSNITQLLSPIASELESVLSQAGWHAFNDKVCSAAKGIKEVAELLAPYVRESVSPRRAVDLLSAKLEIVTAKPDFDTLNTGVESLRKATEDLLPGFSTISCTSWPEYLSQVSRLSDASNALVEFVQHVATEELVVADIKSFFETKIQLDSDLRKFATLPESVRTHDWAQYVSIAGERIAAGGEVVELLLPASAPGISAKGIVLGLSTREEAQNIVSGLLADQEVTALLQELFEGTGSDLDLLASTLKWSEQIVGNREIRNSCLKNLLLSDNALEHYEWAKTTLNRIPSLRQQINDELCSLNTYGSLDAAAWNHAFNGSRNKEYASLVCQRIRAAADNVDEVLPWSKYHNERTGCIGIGLDAFVTAVEGKKLPPTSVGAVFEFVAYRSIGRGIYTSFPELEQFAGEKHQKKRAEFVSLDSEIIALTGKSFAHDIDKAMTLPLGETGFRVSDRTELQLLHHEMSKQKRHIPIRQLVKRAGRAIQALKPCFMMGPMSVAQYLEQGAVEFDMVVMDEASQLRPEEALGAIARGKQLVVVGDPKQLPPTNFFDKMVDGGDDDEDETPALLSGAESILDICQQLFHPVRTLRWHYRSQHESLIAFSNHHFYNGKLVVFPSPFKRNNRLGVRYRYIKNGIYKDRQNLPEAIRVVDAVMEHMIHFPEESLGVVTLNQTQRDLIEDLLDKKLRNIVEAEKYISDWESEGWPFFVKNLENVQGDERDVIFISTTFGKAPGTEKPRQNFGPISRPDGWRRLNVLFTRSRRKIELFTSMQPEDIVLEAKTPAGTKALRDYLDFAKRGVLSSTSVTDREPDSDFEISVGDMLRHRGYEVVPQLGVAGFFIDLVVRNPDRPGEFLAAVECDGATYHSSNSARDRDRIRQSILESLGWKDRIWRIWSTDWFFNPRRESERLLNFLEERRKISAAESAPTYEYDDYDETEAPTGEDEDIADESDDNPSAGNETVFSDDDLYAEVGDRVTYCHVEKPDDRHSIMIVDSQSNLPLNLINENAPLAKALLNAAVGDETPLEIKGVIRLLRVLKIERQAELALE